MTKSRQKKRWPKKMPCKPSSRPRRYGNTTGSRSATSDDIVLYQMGDFFELYGEDAKTAAAELGLNLTTRAIPGGGRVEMCGFPANRLEQVVEHLRDQHDVTISAVPEGGRERQEYSMLSIDHEAEQHINAQEAEFGADGARVFRDTGTAATPTIRELYEKYKPIVMEAVTQDTTPDTVTPAAIVTMKTLSSSAMLPSAVPFSAPVI